LETSIELCRENQNLSKIGKKYSGILKEGKYIYIVHGCDKYFAAPKQCKQISIAVIPRQHSSSVLLTPAFVSIMQKAMHCYFFVAAFPVLLFC
jgi:hypothetical protein